jgi:hypothetical protein
LEQGEQFWSSGRYIEVGRAMWEQGKNREAEAGGLLLEQGEQFCTSGRAVGARKK